MEDCTETQPTPTNLRQKGRNCMNGKIVKGCVQDAGSKVSIGSIPSTYEAIIYRNNSTQAFGSSSFRFNQTSEFINIAPNHYKKEEAAAYRWKNQEGFNKKGTGPFLSKEKRVFKVMPPTPGPGNYQISTSMSTIDTESSSVKAAKQQEALTRQLKRFEDKENNNPGPCDYDPKPTYSKPPGWKSSFESKVSRDQYLELSQTPGPGTYQPQPLTKKNHKSPNKKPSEPTANIEKTILKLMNNNDSLPRQYSYAVPDFQPKYSKIKNSPIFIQGSKDRFGDIKQQIVESSVLLRGQLPGPGSYNLSSEFCVPKEDISSSNFVSQTVRNVFDKVAEKLGPNVQEVFLLGKKRFHLNMEGKWI